MLTRETQTCTHATFRRRQRSTQDTFDFLFPIGLVGEFRAFLSVSNRSITVHKFLELQPGAIHNKDEHDYTSSSTSSKVSRWIHWRMGVNLPVYFTISWATTPAVGHRQTEMSEPQIRDRILMTIHSFDDNVSEIRLSEECTICERAKGM